jgi:hypothetical protein
LRLLRGALLAGLVAAEAHAGQRVDGITHRPITRS